MRATLCLLGLFVASASAAMPWNCKADSSQCSDACRKPDFGANCNSIKKGNNLMWCCHNPFPGCFDNPSDAATHCKEKKPDGSKKLSPDMTKCGEHIYCCSEQCPAGASGSSSGSGSGSGSSSDAAEEESAPKEAVLSAESAKAHHVAIFKTRGVTTLVIRRGAPFTLTSKAIKALQFKGKGGKEAEFEIKAKDDGSFTVAATRPVGRYAVADQDGNSLGQATLLFNPWSSKSSVHFAKDTDFNNRAYVMKESGHFFYGSWHRWGYGQWQYHQFSPEVLEAVALLLDALPADERHDPVHVSRHLTEVLNAGWELHANGAMEMEGVLWGRWDGEYDDGEKPTHWSSSRKIFKQWLGTKRAVKYGQCWVFSSILVSALRCLGIPARGVTNYRSGHDTPDAYGQYDHVVHHKDESVWNFHVWVDACMKRPDLQDAQGYAPAPEGCEWNAVDATPQEESDGAYRMGPALVRLVKQNKALTDGANYDAAFLVGEVNGVHQKAESYDLADIGRLTLTMKATSSGEDKFTRGALEERLMSSYKMCKTALHKVEDDGKTCTAPPSGPGHADASPDQRFRALRQQQQQQQQQQGQLRGGISSGGEQDKEATKKPTPAAAADTANTAGATADTADAAAANETPKAKRVGKFEVFRGKDSQFYFRLKASNGRAILRSEGYKQKAGALAGIKSVRENAAKPAMFKKESKVSAATKKPYHFFNLVAGNNQKIGHSQMYKQAAGMEKGVRSVAANAPTAPVVDLSDKATDASRVATCGTDAEKEKLQIGKKQKPCNECMELKVKDEDKLEMGQEITFTVTAAPAAAEKAKGKAWTVQYAVEMIVYNGHHLGVPIMKGSVKLEAGGSAEVKIPAATYEAKLANAADIRIMTQATAGGLADYDEAQIYLEKPPLKLLLNGAAAAAESTEVTVEITNPLTTIALKGCAVAVDSDAGDEDLAVDGEIKPKAKVTKTFAVKSDWVTVSVDCKNLLGQGWSRTARWAPGMTKVLSDGIAGPAAAPTKEAPTKEK